MSKNAVMYFKIFIFIFILTGCSSTQKPIKPPMPKVIVSQSVNTDFLKAYGENSDLVFLLKTEDYRLYAPVMQTKNNSDYLRKDFYKKDSVFGTPFVDYRVNLDTGQNIVIYGHSTLDGKLFGELASYKDIEDIQNKIILTDKNSIQKYAVFSVFEQDVYGENLFDFSKVTFTKKEFEQFISSAKELSTIKVDTPEKTEKITTLVTCENTATDRRLVVMAYLNNN